MFLWGVTVLQLDSYPDHNKVMSYACNVYSYDAVWAEHQTQHLPDTKRMRYVLRNWYLIITKEIKVSLAVFISTIHNGQI